MDIRSRGIGDNSKTPAADYFDDIPPPTSPDDYGTASVEQVIAEGASYAEAAKPLSERERYLDAVRQNEAKGRLRSRFHAAMLALSSDDIHGREARVVWAILVLMQGGLSLGASVRQIAKVAGYSEKTVNNTLPRLERAGVILRVKMALNGSGPAVTHITIAPSGREASSAAIKQALKDLGPSSNYISRDVLIAPPTGLLTAPSAVQSGLDASEADCPAHGAVRSAESVLTAPPTGQSENHAYIRNARAPLMQTPTVVLPGSANSNGDGERTASPRAAAAGPSILERRNQNTAEQLGGGLPSPLVAPSSEIVDTRARAGGLFASTLRGSIDDVELPLAIAQALDAVKATGRGRVAASTLMEAVRAARSRGIPAAILKADMGKAASAAELEAESSGRAVTATMVLDKAGRYVAHSRYEPPKATADGTLRRYADRLDSQLVNAASYPLTKSTANAILNVADRLRTKPPIANTAHLEAIIGELRRGDEPTHDELARLVATRAVRDTFGITGEFGFLTGSHEARIVAEIQARWPHVPADLIDSQVSLTSSNPEAAGVSRYDWTGEAADHVGRVLVERFGTVVAAYQRHDGFEPVEELWLWCDGARFHGPIAEALNRSLSRRGDGEALAKAINSRVSDRLPDLRKRWGTVDFVAAAVAVIQGAADEIAGPGSVDLSGLELCMTPMWLEQPFKLTGAPAPSVR